MILLLLLLIFKNFDSYFIYLCVLFFVVHMDVAVAISYIYLKYTKYINICYLLCFVSLCYFLFILMRPIGMYVYAFGLVECHLSLYVFCVFVSAFVSLWGLCAAIYCKVKEQVN